jgi:1-acyl-sn-glycerol-3-phosphate acyltransferase
LLTRRGGRTLIGSLLWLPFSLAAWVLSIVWMILLFISLLPLWAFRPFEKIQLLWAHPMLGWPVYFTFSRFRREEDPRYDRKRVVMFVQNHVSMFDGVIACASIRVPLCGLENAAHLKVPGYGWLLRGANAVPVEKGARRYVQLAEAIKERAARGISIVTFPEAHRTLDGKVQPFRRGVFRMARDAGIPIVPLGVRGAFRMLPKGALTMRPANLEVYVAPPIETEGLSDQQLVEVMDRAHQVLTAWVERREKLGDLCVEPIGDTGAAAE